jgi:acyl-coenzyme A synthetase/AMP-(fatty) acid ligase
MHTIFDQIRVHAAVSPMKPAIMLPDRVVTYDMLAKGISSVQTVLASLTLDRNRPVGILIDSPTRHIIVLLALMKSGFTFVSIRNDQIDLAMQCGVNVVFTDTTLPILPNLRPCWVDEQWFTNSCKNANVDTDFPPNRIARIVFTSGSTGQPKAIGWTFRALHQRVQEMYLAGIASHPRVLTNYGLSTVGFSSAFRVLSSGNTIVFAPLHDTLKTISDFAVTEIRSSVAQIRTLLELDQRLRYSISIPQVCPGGGQLTVEMTDEIERRFRSRIINTYISTESGHLGLASDEVLRLRRAKGNCFVPLADIEIVDDSGTKLAVGREGRIRARTYSMGWPFAGNLTETDDVKGDGWFYPGDVGLIDSDGLLIVTSRVDEVINDGGVKFSPEVMEAHLKRHPRIDDVAIVRMPIDSGKAEPWIAVVTKDRISLDHIQEWIEQNIPGELNSVRFARLFFVDSIPATATGKVARQELRDLLRSKQ